MGPAPPHWGGAPLHWLETHQSQCRVLVALVRRVSHNALQRGHGSPAKLVASVPLSPDALCPLGRWGAGLTEQGPYLCPMSTSHSALQRALGIESGGGGEGCHFCLPLFPTMLLWLIPAPLVSHDALRLVGQWLYLYLTPPPQFPTMLCAPRQHLRVSVWDCSQSS